MKLLLKQRFFSWLDSYDIYDEENNPIFTVKGELAFGKRLNVYSEDGMHLATLQQKILTFLPKFEIYIGDNYAGEIAKEFTFFKPAFDIDYLGWHVEGDFFEWDYEIFDKNGKLIATVSKELFNFTDTYCIDVESPSDSLHALMLVLAIDAEKESDN